MSKRTSDLSAAKENLLTQLNEEDLNKNESNRKEERSRLFDERERENENSAQTQNTEYKDVYESFKKTKYYLHLIEIFRVVFVIMFSLVIYFDFFLIENLMIIKKLW